MQKLTKLYILTQNPKQHLLKKTIKKSKVGLQPSGKTPSKTKKLLVNLPLLQTRQISLIKVKTSSTMPAQLPGYGTVFSMRILSVLLIALFLSACSSPDNSLDEKNAPIVSIDPIFAKTIAPIIITNPVDFIELLVGQNLVFRTFPDAELTSSTLSVTNGDSTIVLLKNGETFETFTTAPGLTALSEGNVAVTLTNGEFVQVYSIMIKLPVVGSNPPIESTNPPLGLNNDPGIVVDAPNDSVEMPIYDNFFDAEAKQTAIFAQKIIGMEFFDAKFLLERSNISVRIGQEDGMVFAVTMDYKPSRITLSIVSGIITSASVG